jgi:hypothetical protein
MNELSSCAGRYAASPLHAAGVDADWLESIGEEGIRSSRTYCDAQSQEGEEKEEAHWREKIGRGKGKTRRKMMCFKCAAQNWISNYELGFTMRIPLSFLLSPRSRQCPIKEPRYLRMTRTTCPTERSAAMVRAQTSLPKLSGVNGAVRLEMKCEQQIDAATSRATAIMSLCRPCL